MLKRIGSAAIAVLAVVLLIFAGIPTGDKKPNTNPSSSVAPKKS